MKHNKNVMILNGQDIGISKIELNRSDLLIFDKSGKYCLQICIEFNWKDINSIKLGTKKENDFYEYCLSENNEPALVWPTLCYIEKISDNYIYFNLEFKDLDATTHYMNKKGHFDIDLKTLECKIFIDYNDAIEDFIIYEFR